MEKTITTYCKPWHGYQAEKDIIYGRVPFYAGYKIKDYTWRKTNTISPASLNRIRRFLNQSHRLLSDSGPSWYRTVHYFD